MKLEIQGPDKINVTMTDTDMSMNEMAALIEQAFETHKGLRLNIPKSITFYPDPLLMQSIITITTK